MTRKETQQAKYMTGSYDKEISSALTVGLVNELTDKG